MSTATEIARDLIRATNRTAWCMAHCRHYVDEKWDNRVQHDPKCPLLTK